MGLLVDGVWHDRWYDTAASGGTFQRTEATFRNWVTADGAPGPSGRGGFAAEPGRYHLYISHACPWAHRTAIVRVLKGLDGMIGLSAVNWFMGERGWTFEPGPGVIADPIHGARTLAEVYLADDPAMTGRVTTPVLWDRTTGRIVSNESSEIIRMLGSAFDGVGARPLVLYPEALRAEIDAVNARVYDNLNNGVYKAGFANAQAAYEAAATGVFDTLDWLEARLAGQRYVTGPALTEADWRLFTTLIRFDAVYVGHFKCNRRRIADYPNLSGYTRELYQVPGVAGTTHFDHIRHHYYESHPTINPSRIVPIGPELDVDAPHGRGHLTVA